MNARIENGRAVFSGEPLKASLTVVKGGESQRTEHSLTAEQMNSIGWTVDRTFSSHSAQIENVKEMFYYGAGGSSAVFGDIRSMKQAMDGLAEGFFDGSVTADELAGGFRSLAEKFSAACSEKQYPFSSLSGFGEAELSFAYDCFRGAILKAATARNSAEGSALCSKQNSGWHYYNADYYHKSESAIAAITGSAQELAAEKGYDRFGIPDYKALGKNSLYNFNSAVSGESDYIPGGLRAVEEKWITDFDAVPPEGFKWFCETGGSDGRAVFVEGDELPREKTTVWAAYRGLLASASPDLSQSGPKSLADLLQFRPAGKKEFAAVNRFMKSFRIAPPGYFAGQGRGGAGWNIKA